MVQVEHGFVIVRPNGRMLTNDLYRQREAAISIVDALYPDHTVRPARKVTRLRQVTATTAQPHSEIIVEAANSTGAELRRSREGGFNSTGKSA